MDDNRLGLQRAREGWRRHTPARVALGRAGAAISIDHVLQLRAAHAEACDAVHSPFDIGGLRAALSPLETRVVRSRAADRAEYLRRPDLGRSLDDQCRDELPSGPFDVAVICADGLSAQAVTEQAPRFVPELMARLPALDFSPVVIASEARVALSDQIGEAMQARLALILIGERPGLSVARSMGAYLTFGPRKGLSDAQRNCISNIHADGLAPTDAAAKAAWLVEQALARGLSGVRLKDGHGATDLLEDRGQEGHLGQS